MKIIILYCVLVALFTNCQNKKMTIVKNPILTYIDSPIDRGKKIVMREDDYLIRNYKKNIKNNQMIDSFAKLNLQSKNKFYDNYRMSFSKENSVTKKIDLSLRRNILDRYFTKEDLICSFSWSDKGKFFVKEKYKDGVMIEPNSVIEIGPAKPD